MKKVFSIIVLIASSLCLFSCASSRGQLQKTGADPFSISTTGLPTGEINQSIMVDGPLIWFINSYYRFPETKEEFYDYFAQEYGNIYGRKQIKRWTKKTQYELFAPDSCHITGGIFGDDEYIVIDTPIYRLNKLNSIPKERNIEKKEALLNFLNHYTPAFFDEYGNVLLNLRERNLEGEFSKSIKEFSYTLQMNNVHDSLSIPIPYFFYLKYDTEDGLHMFSKGCDEKDRAILSLIEESLSSSPFQSIYNNIIRACSIFTEHHLEVHQIVFLSPVAIASSFDESSNSTPPTT